MTLHCSPEYQKSIVAKTSAGVAPILTLFEPWAMIVNKPDKVSLHLRTHQISNLSLVISDKKTFKGFSYTCLCKIMFPLGCSQIWSSGDVLNKLPGSLDNASLSKLCDSQEDNFLDTSPALCPPCFNMNQQGSKEFHSVT